MQKFKTQIKDTDLKNRENTAKMPKTTKIPN